MHEHSNPAGAIIGSQNGLITFSWVRIFFCSRTSIPVGTKDERFCLSNIKTGDNISHVISNIINFYSLLEFLSNNSISMLFKKLKIHIFCLAMAWRSRFSCTDLTLLFQILEGLLTIKFRT